jgi:hypothetical protein
MALLFAGAIGFVVLGGWIVGAFGSPPDTSFGARAAGWAAIVFFGLCGLVGGGRLFDAGTEIRVDGRGIWWRRWSDDTVPWAAIARVEMRAVRGHRFACLFLRDPGAYRATTLAGRLAGLNKAMGFGDIAITTNGTDASFGDLMAAIDRFAPPGTAV